MRLQYIFIFIMIHCESSVECYFFPNLFDQEISPHFLVVQLLAFEELFMGFMKFQSWEKTRKLQTDFDLKSLQDFLMATSKWMAGLTLSFVLFYTLFIYLFLILFIYLFLVVLGLRFCVRAFSSCGKQGPLFIAVRGPLTIAASLVAEHRLQMRRLSSCGSRA